MSDRDDAKAALDVVIRKSRVHLYKPIQIAEILYHDRVFHDIDLSQLEAYRNKSKKWRDVMSLLLVGRKCTSSARFQDNLFEENALPPAKICVLGKENRRTNGAVEAYIYSRITKKMRQLSDALSYCRKAGTENFDLKMFLDSFWQEPGLRRSIDKIYEIVVYALCHTLLDALHVQVEIRIDETARPLLTEFEDFARKVMRLNAAETQRKTTAQIYRVGKTNAADRGLDMYANFGPAIQVKHLSLDVNRAKDIAQSISCDPIIIVCKEAEKNVIVSLLTQIGWREHIQSIITEDDLVEWYEKALHGIFADTLSDPLLESLCEEIAEEFPSLSQIPKELKSRKYDNISDSFWI